MSTTHKFEVTTRDIKRFMQATGQLWSDTPTASEEPFSIAPPLFCQVMTFEDVPLVELPSDFSPKELNVDVSAQRTVGGSSDYSFYKSVRAGDIITVTSTLSSVTEKHGKSGVLYLVEIETHFSNQNDEPIAREIATYVKR